MTALTRSPTWCALARDLLAARQQRLALAERHDGGAGVHAGDGADDEFALLAGELVEDRVRFGLADLLDDHLLGRLRGDAAERLGVEFQLAVAGDDVPGGLVDGDEDALFDAEVPLGGDLDGRRDAAEDRLAGDLPLLVELVHEFEDRLAGVFVLGHRSLRLKSRRSYRSIGPITAPHRHPKAHRPRGYAPRRGCRGDSSGRDPRPAEPTPDTPTRAAQGRCIVGSWFLTWVLSPPKRPKARAHAGNRGIFRPIPATSVPSRESCPIGTTDLD